MQPSTTKPTLDYEAVLEGGFAKGKRVPIFIRGTPQIVIIGEAPGPRGASVTGYPFWGDISGRQLYELIFQLGLMNEARFKPEPTPNGKITTPPEGNYAIANAYDRMPWDPKKKKFTAPKLAGIKSQSARLRRELSEASAPAILAVGLAAARAVHYAFDSKILPDEKKLNLSSAIEACLKSKGFRLPLDSHAGCTARLFITFHPSYGQWKKEPSGNIHKKVMTQLSNFLKRCR